jgi:hypothetical protein
MSISSHPMLFHLFQFLSLLNGSEIFGLVLRSESNVFELSSITSTHRGLLL